LPFKCNLQRYNVAATKGEAEKATAVAKAGSCTAAWFQLTHSA
jgi:hypothetical protein